MTIKIELPDAVRAVVSAKIICRSGECGLDADSAITAALEAMVECGMARPSTGYVVRPDNHWCTEEGVPGGEHTFPALIIRLDGGKK